MTVRTVRLNGSLKSNQTLVQTLQKMGKHLINEGRADAEMYPQESISKDVVLDVLTSDRLPILVSEDSTKLPYLRGYKWLNMGLTGFWSWVFYPKIRDPILPKDIKHSRDWPLPVPQIGPDGNKKGWSPICYVKVEELNELPLWLLHNPKKVFLPEAWEFLSISELKKGKTSLNGKEILKRVPWEISLLMSVAGWPLQYVPIRYLIWLASQGEYTGDTAPQTKRIYHPRTSCKKIKLDPFTSIDKVEVITSEVWTKSVITPRGVERISYEVQLPSTVRIRNENDSFRPIRDPQLRFHLLNYLNSAEGKERSRHIEVDPENELPGWSPVGTWTGGVSLSEQFWEKGQPGFANKDPYQGVESFSQRDTDRFGKWGNPILQRFLETGKGQGFLRRIIRSAAEGDETPTPEGFYDHTPRPSKGQRIDRSTLKDKVQWCDPTWEEDVPKPILQWNPTTEERKAYLAGKLEPCRHLYFFASWTPPAIPETPEQAFEIAFNQIEQLEEMTKKWKRRWELFRTNPMSDSELEAFEFDRRDDSDLLLSINERMYSDLTVLLEGYRCDQVLPIRTPRGWYRSPVTFLLNGISQSRMGAYNGDQILQHLRESIGKAKTALEGNIDPMEGLNKERILKLLTKHFYQIIKVMIYKEKGKRKAEKVIERIEQGLQADQLFGHSTPCRVHVLGKGLNFEYRGGITPKEVMSY